MLLQRRQTSSARITWVVFDETTDTIIKRLPLVGLQLLITQSWCLETSFEDFEVEYKFLKAVIEGGIEARPDNLLIYATSNRRHLIKETWNDRSDMEHNGDIHRSDTLEEKLSLANRFGLAINFSSPNRKQYHEIVKTLADRAGIVMDESELYRKADAWEIRHGGVSGRAAQQFVNDLICSRKY